MMTDIVLPQAIRFTIPPGTGIAISLIKDTALASVVAMPDLLKQATQAQAYYANPTPLIGAAMLPATVAAAGARGQRHREPRQPPGSPIVRIPPCPRRRTPTQRTPELRLRRWKNTTAPSPRWTASTWTWPVARSSPSSARPGPADAGALREPAGNL